MYNKTKTDNKETNLHVDHRKRMRDKCLESGAKDLEDHQLLEVALYYCVARKDTNGLAHELLNEYGSLLNIFTADPVDLQNRCGITEYMSLFFITLSEVMNRCNYERTKIKTPLNTLSEVGKYCVSLFPNSKYEKFYLICLDNQRRLLNTSLISSGTINQSTIYKRLLVEKATRFNAEYVIFAHNHPGGIALPSTEDISLTKFMVAVLNTLDIIVSDHIIVAGDDYFSMSNKSMINNEGVLKDE